MTDRARGRLRERWTLRTRQCAWRLALGLLLLFESGAIGQAQQAEQLRAQSFDVASVRPNKSAGFSLVGVQVRPNGMVVAENTSLRRLIIFAYGLETYQDVEGDFELLDQNFDVMARASQNVALTPAGQVGPLNVMMQNLLADRFNLAVQWEERTRAGYVLVRLDADGPLGPRIHRSDLECPRPPSDPVTTGDTRSCFMKLIGTEVDVTGRRMTDIARLLSTALQSPVIDRTGLVGSFDVRMTFDSRDLPAFGGLRPNLTPEPGPRLPSLFTAIQEQWGLGLEARRVPVSMLIVTNLEPLTEN